MNIREWFGSDTEYDSTSDINICIDGLLELSARAIMGYFSIHDASNYQVILNVKKEGLEKGQQLFLNWLAEKGFPYFKELAAKDLPNDGQLISKLEYDKYMLEEELDFQFLDDLRSVIISIVNDVPEYIRAASEVSVSSKPDGYDTLSSNMIVTVSLESLYYEEDFYDPMSNYNESTIKVGSYLLFWGNLKNGNNGVLQTH